MRGDRVTRGFYRLLLSSLALKGGFIFMTKEAAYQSKLVKRIKDRFPGSIVMKTDPTQRQGMPDLLILHEDKWASLEVKRSEKAPRRPNQEYYVDKLNKMSFSSFIFPENEEEVLNAMERSFES